MERRMSTAAKKTSQPAAPAAPAQQYPSEGGSFVRQPDGSLKKQRPEPDTSSNPNT
jgi:hypothetical protein